MAILEVFLGGGLALGGALGATWLQNRHDAKQRERERQLTLRRDVYLEAAEGLAGVQEFLGGIADPNRPMDQLLQALKVRPGWQNKIQVVASFKTIKAFAEADQHLVTATVDSIPLRYQLEHTKSLLASQQEKIQQHRKYQEYMITSFKNQIERLPPERAIAEASRAQEEVQGAQQVIDQLESEQGALLAKNARQTTQLVLEVMDRSAAYRFLTARALLELRTEIDLPLPEAEFLELTRKTQEKLHNSLKRLLDEDPEESAPDSAQ